MARKVIVIGAGFSGLSAATFMARAGWEVHVIEKHGTPGGRARRLEENGFVFDMGPSWYWMPDVFERYFRQFGKSVSDYYQLKRLNPSYRVYWDDGPMDIPADMNQLKDLFESLEPGGGKKLQEFLNEASYKYRVGIQNLVFKPGQSLLEYLDWNVISGIFKMDVFTSMKMHVRKFFKHKKLQQLLEFPVLFLGALPESTPALYSLMNYADMVGGTWYPLGGIYSVVQAMHDLATACGVQFHFNENVTELILDDHIVKGVITQYTPPEADGPTDMLDRGRYKADVVIGSADYHFIETALIPEKLRSYSEAYWSKRVMAPSCLLYYVGLNKRLTNVHHHSLFFDVPFDQHAEEIYTKKQWPENPLFYVSATSVSDPAVAPDGCENLFFLIPVSSGLGYDTSALRDRYFNMIVERMESITGESIREAIIFRKSFAGSDFLSEYNSFKGNAYGLANTLLQTAIMKPSCRSKKIRNLFYTGQLTVPGPGVPPSIISGEVVATQVLKHYG